MPKNDKVIISLALSKDLLANLDERAAALGMSRSAYMRMLLVLAADKKASV